MIQGTPKRGALQPQQVVYAENVVPQNQLQFTPVQQVQCPSSPVYASPPPYYDNELYGPKTQKVSFKPPARNTTSAIYEWAGYEFCLGKSYLNEKTCAELRKRYKALKDLPPGIDYNAIHSTCTLHPELLDAMLQQYRDFLNDTQLVAPGQYESLFHYLERVQKLTAKTEKKAKSS